jgi:hypothetical protein
MPQRVLDRQNLTTGCDETAREEVPRIFHENSVEPVAWRDFRQARPTVLA